MSLTVVIGKLQCDSRDRLQPKKIKESDLAFLLKSLAVKLWRWGSNLRKWEGFFFSFNGSYWEISLNMSLKMWEEIPREMGGSRIKDTWKKIIVETLLPASEIREDRVSIEQICCPEWGNWGSWLRTASVFLQRCWWNEPGTLQTRK